MSFRQRVRLPIYVTRPQFPDETNLFRLANGATKVQSVIIRKVYETETDWLPEQWHERLKIALKHDNVTIEGYRYLGGVAVDGDYDIAWQTNMLDYPLAKAAFKLEVTPYNYTNDNCQTCEEVTQLALVDDTITGLYESLEEGSTTEYNVFTNDSICCKPITAEIVTINSTYVQSAEIDSTNGVVTITLHPTTPSGTNLNLLTYRVTCPNGSYDDADVFANVSGSEESCEAPPNLDAGTISQNGATPNWFGMLEPLPLSYNYSLYLSSDLFTPVDSGNTTDIAVEYTDLMAGTCYTFFVQSVCESGTSEFVSIEFCTPVGDGNCGRYLVSQNDGSGEHGGGVIVFSYINCSGNPQNDFITNMQSKIICVLENSPGSPVQITGVTAYEYVEPCA